MLVKDFFKNLLFPHKEETEDLIPRPPEAAPQEGRVRCAPGDTRRGGRGRGRSCMARAGGLGERALGARDQQDGVSAPAPSSQGREALLGSEH